MDAEGARALARRIAAQEEAEQAEPASATDGQTLEERLAAPTPGSEDGPEEEVPPTIELRVYARAVEEHLAGGLCTYVEVWWCRVRDGGIWQAPYVVREVVRETLPVPTTSRRRRPAVRMLMPWNRSGP